MKKLLAIFMCLIMAALLIACGDKGESSTAASSSEEFSGLQAMDAPTEDALGWGDFEIVEQVWLENTGFAV